MNSVTLIHSILRWKGYWTGHRILWFQSKLWNLLTVCLWGSYLINLDLGLLLCKRVVLKFHYTYHSSAKQWLFSFSCPLCKNNVWVWLFQVLHSLNLALLVMITAGSSQPPPESKWKWLKTFQGIPLFLLVTEYLSHLLFSHSGLVSIRNVPSDCAPQRINEWMNEWVNEWMDE
jgi:hypothetical protein